MLASQVLEKLRRRTFPAIGLGIISGINVYDEKFDPKQLTLSYLYSNLENSIHIEKLFELLDVHGFDFKIRKRAAVKIKRLAAYKLQAGWEVR